MDAPIPGPIVIVVDCPTNSHAQELISTQSRNDYYSDSSCQSQSSKIVNCVIHLGPASVVNSSHYKKWMNKFTSAQHIMVGCVMKEVQNPILKSSARITECLNYLCPHLFPPMSSASDHNFLREDSTSKLSNAIFAENLLKFIFRPHARLGFDRSDVPSPLPASTVIDELLLEIPDIIDARQHVSQLWQKPTATNKCANSIPVV